MSDKEMFLKNILKVYPDYGYDFLNNEYLKLSMALDDLDIQDRMLKDFLTDRVKKELRAELDKSGISLKLLECCRIVLRGELSK